MEEEPPDLFQAYSLKFGVVLTHPCCFRIFVPTFKALGRGLLLWRHSKSLHVHFVESGC